MIENLQKTTSKRQPLVGHFEITHKCCFSCDICYNDIKPSQKEISTDEAFHIINEITDEGCFYLNISGGEPLIRNDFVEIYLYAKKKGIHVSIESNGFLLNTDLEKLFINYPPDNFNLSLYGMSQETFEKFTNTSLDYNIVINNITRLKKKGIDFIVRTPITKDNYSEINQMKSFAESIGIKYKYDPKIWWNASGKRLNHLRCKSEDLLTLVKNNELYSNIYNELLILEKQAYNVSSCRWGIYEFYINPYAELHYCNVFWNTIYDLRKGSFKDAWEKFYPKFRKKNSCLGRHVLPTNGNCPAGYIYFNTSEDATLNLQQRIKIKVDELQEDGLSEKEINSLFCMDGREL